MPKLKKCAVCKELFEPRNSMQKACSPGCALEIVKGIRVKKERAKATAERKETRQKLNRLKPLSAWLKEAQTACNAFIRERDKDLPCISCGRFHQGAWDAGHYRSVGAAPSLRFDEANIHRQCVPCNQHKSGNILEYRIGLIARIGQAEVDRIEGPLKVAKYTIDDAKRIKAYFVEKLKILRKSAVQCSHETKTTNQTAHPDT